MRITPIRRRDFIKRLRAFGWLGPFAGGKHEYLIKGARKVHIPNPHGGELSVGKLRELLKEFEISPEEWQS